jgi:hypothetical protein
MATTTSVTAENEHGHPNIVLATLALASLMGVMDLFIVNVALHTIGSHLDLRESRYRHRHLALQRRRKMLLWRISRCAVVPPKDRTPGTSTRRTRADFRARRRSSGTYCQHPLHKAP